MPNEMLKETAKLLHMLIGDAYMSSVFPFEGNPYITRACAAISTNNLQPYIMDKIKEYSKEVVHLLYLSQIHECIDVFTCFMLCIISDIDEIHHDKRLLNKHNQYLAATTHLVALLTTFCLQENSCARCLTLQSMEQVHSLIMMTTHLWILCVRRNFQVYHMVAIGTCLFGFAPYMGTHMVSTSSIRRKGAGIHSVHCISFWRMCQSISFMILHAPFQIMHSTGHQSSLDSLDSGMISSMPLATNLV